MYSKDKVWVGRNIEFKQIDKSTKESEFLGKAGLTFIDNQKEEYLLGKGVEFVSIKDKLTIKAPALFWIKKENILSSAEKDAVEITKENEMSIKGSGFIANTARKEFELKTKVEGIIDTTKKEESEEVGRN